MGIFRKSFRSSKNDSMLHVLIIPPIYEVCGGIMFSLFRTYVRSSVTGSKFLR